MTRTEAILDIATLRARYLAQTLRPAGVVEEIVARIEARTADNIWIHVLPREALLARAQALARQDARALPLYGIPFAIKDNIDLAGAPTTAACPAFTYVPSVSARVVERLIAAGAMPVGKTNLDQFATGLVGVRSPYGACRNPIDPRYIAGGSSAGSAAAVAADQVSFALGTDTAGSGRIPAAFCNLVGLKPTRGLVSTAGVVPACRSLDCVSIFARTAAEAIEVLEVCQAFDPQDPFSRRAEAPSAPPIPDTGLAGLRFGVPRDQDLEFFGDAEAALLFERALERIEAFGGRCVRIDLSPFLAAARLLYEGPWVAERYLAVRALIERQPDALHPITRRVIERGRDHSALDAFGAYYQLRALKRETEAAWATMDILLTPTAGTIYTIAAVEADPVRLNANLGYYTNFVNLLDLSAIAVPAGWRSDGLPFGVTFLAPAFHDRTLAQVGARFHAPPDEAVGTNG